MREIQIPEELQDVCRAIGRIAKEAKLSSLGGSFYPGMGHGWNEKIHFSWMSGRHEEEVDCMTIWSEKRIQVKIEG